MSETQLETMANEDASINSLNQRKPKTKRSPKAKKINTLKIKKYRVKSVTNVNINMAKTNVTQKESDVPSALRQYRDYRDELSSVDGLLFRAQRLIVPHSWRKEMLDRIHKSHQGIVTCKQRARDILFWPGMSSQIEDKVSKCSTCSQFQRAQPKEPMVIQELPDRPWAKIGSDLFEFNGAH